MRRLRYPAAVAFWLWLLMPAYAAETITFQLPAAILPPGETSIEWNCGTVKVIAPPAGNGMTRPVRCTVEVSVWNQYAISAVSLPAKSGRLFVLLAPIKAENPKPPEPARRRIVGKGGPK